MENSTYFREILRSKEENRILTGKIAGIEDEYYKLQDKYIPCGIVWYGDVKVLIPVTHMGISIIGVSIHSKSLLRGMQIAEIDFIVIEIDEVSNIAIASRQKAMEIRSSLELPKLKTNDIVRVRIVATSQKHIIVDLYRKRSYNFRKRPKTYLYCELQGKL